MAISISLRHLSSQTFWPPEIKSWFRPPMTLFRHANGTSGTLKNELSNFWRETCQNASDTSSRTPPWPDTAGLIPALKKNTLVLSNVSKWSSVGFGMAELEEKKREREGGRLADCRQQFQCQCLLSALIFVYGRQQENKSPYYDLSPWPSTLKTQDFYMSILFRKSSP